MLQGGTSRVSLTNLHVPWDSVKLQEEQIVAINKLIEMQKEEVDYFIMLGDFNSGVNTNV